MSSPPAADVSRPAASVRTPLKRFTHSQIADKVRERSGVAEYEALLMSAAVQQDEGGVVFDSTAAGWKELVSRCEQADRDNAKRRKERPQHSTTQLGAASSARSASPAAALSAASVSSVPVASSIAPSAATSLFSKLSAAIATKASTEHGGEERETKEDGAANGENARKQLSARGRPAAAPRARRGSQPTAAPPPSAQPAMAQPVESAESDTQHNRRTKRATAAATLPSAIHVGGNEPPAAVPAAATGETESAALSASPSHSDSRRLRSVRMLHSAAHRTNADRIKRSANKHVRDAQQMQADLAFEQRLTDEVDDKYSDEQLSEEWKERRQRDNEREAERKRREDEDERLRIAAGGRKKRKLVIPTAAQIRHPQSGEPIDELDYMQVLLQQLNEPDDSRVDWWLAGQLAIVTGLPHQHRMRVWSVMLKQRIAASEQQQQQQQQGEGDELEAAISVLQQSAEDTHEASVLSPGSDSSSLPSSSLPSPKLDLINQRTVRVDIDRTLPHFVRMQRQDVKHDMEVILTAYDTNTTEPWRYRTLSQSAQPDQPAHSAASAPCVVDAVLRYCKRHRLTYKQGMNYLLAPFFFLVSPPLSSSSRRSVLSLYASFIGTFVPNTFADDEFGSLQCVFLLFRHLLLYHDPQLCAHLDANEMGPELYASSWFITLYANRCKMEVVLYLWDIMLLEAAHDPMLHYFVSLALLIANRAAILKEPNVSLPEQLTKLTIGNKKDAHTLVQRAKQLYRHNTSRSIRDKLRHITHAKISIDSPAYTELQQWQALHVSAEEVVQHIVQRGVAKADSAGSSAQKDDTATEPSTTGDLAEPKFFVLDCRPLSQYNSGHLPMSFHLDPDLLEERRAEELERRLDALMGMRGCHLCFADAAVDDEPLDSSNEPSSINSGSNNGNNAPSPQLAFLSLLLRRNFKYLSIISGGFAACHARILSLDRSSELVDHRPDECLECNGRRFSRKEKKSLFNSMSAGMKRLGMGMIARLDQQQSSASTSASAALAADGAAGGSSSLYYNLSAEHKADNVPDGVVVLPATHQLKLLLTGLRDRNSDDAVFAGVVARLCAILLGTAIERMEMRERHVNTASGGMYSGTESAAPLCTLALTHSAEQLLTSAVAPYVQLLKVYRGRAIFQPQHHHNQLSIPEPSLPSASAAAVLTATATPTASVKPPPSPRVLVDVALPDSLLDYRVLLLVPQLDGQSYPELLSLLTHLQGCGCELSALTVCCITAARPALWSVMSVYPTLALISTAVDEVRHGQLVPGIRALDSRSALHSVNSQQHSASEPGNAKPQQPQTAQHDAVDAAVERGVGSMHEQADGRS